MTQLVLCKYVACFLNSLPEQMLALDKIFMTVSSTTFVHVCCYSQHKMRVPRRGSNIILSKHQCAAAVMLSLELL